MKSKNIMIITLVPLRADHLSCYGYHRDTTPNIDRIAAEGTIFERAYSTAVPTPPAHASLLTGLYPSCHGVFGSVGSRDSAPTVLGDSVPTMGTLLSDMGYRTVAFVNDYHVGKFKGLDRGFQGFYIKGRNQDSKIVKVRAALAVIRRILRGIRKGIARQFGLTDFVGRFARGVEAKARGRLNPSRSTRDTRRTTRRAIEWLDAHGRRKQPFFMLLHYNNMHHPYAAPHPYTYRYVSRQAPGVDWRRIRWISAEPHVYMNGQMDVTPQDFEVLKALYDAEIHYVDKELGQLFAHMRKLGILDQTLLIILSPHGDSFGEHGQTAHGGRLYETLVHVPLIVRCPGTAPAGLSVRSLVQLTDILPTVLELVGRDTDDLMLQGHSLLPMRPDRTYREYVIAESQGPYVQKLKKLEQQLERFKRGHRMLRQGDIWWPSNRSARAMAARLEEWLGSFEHRTGEPEPEKIEEEILKNSGRGAIGFRRRVRPHSKSAHRAAARVRMRAGLRSRAMRLSSSPAWMR